MQKISLLRVLSVSGEVREGASGCAMRPSMAGLDWDSIGTVIVPEIGSGKDTREESSHLECFVLSNGSHNVRIGVGDVRTVILWETVKVSRQRLPRCRFVART